MKSLYMEHTTVEVSKTVGEISACLQAIGAMSITSTFKNMRISGVTWAMLWNGKQVHFKMPARVEPVFGIMRKRRGRMSERDTNRLMEQAERVAWRQLLRWIQAQTALIETQMVKPTEPFVGYAVTPDGRTMHDSFEAHLAITDGSEG